MSQSGPVLSRVTALCLPAVPSVTINLHGVEMSPQEPWDTMSLPDVSDIPRAVVNLANVNSISSQITVSWPLIATDLTSGGAGITVVVL